MSAAAAAQRARNVGSFRDYSKQILQVGKDKQKTFVNLVDGSKRFVNKPESAVVYVSVKP